MLSEGKLTVRLVSTLTDQFIQKQGVLEQSLEESMRRMAELREKKAAETGQTLRVLRDELVSSWEETQNTYEELWRARTKLEAYESELADREEGIRV